MCLMMSGGGKTGGAVKAEGIASRRQTNTSQSKCLLFFMKSAGVKHLRALSVLVRRQRTPDTEGRQSTTQ